MLLEAANFEPIGVLRTSERLGLRTEGSNRWEKGVDPHLAEPAAILASRLLVDLAGAEMTGSPTSTTGCPSAPWSRSRPERTRASSGSTSPTTSSGRSSAGSSSRSTTWARHRADLARA